MVLDDLPENYGAFDYVAFNKKLSNEDLIVLCSRMNLDYDDCYLTDRADCIDHYDGECDDNCNYSVLVFPKNRFDEFAKADWSEVGGAHVDKNFDLFMNDCAIDADND